MQMIWTERAASDLSAIRAYIARNNERAANEMVVRILARTEQQLSSLPKSGRPGR
jgi:plasmid stabilization system protein ParE